MALSALTPTQGDIRFGFDAGINPATGLPWRALRTYQSGIKFAGGRSVFGQQDQEATPFDPSTEHIEPGPDGQMYIVSGATEQSDGGSFGLGGLLQVPGEIARGSMPGLAIPALAAGVNLGVGSRFLPTPDSIATVGASSGSGTLASVGGSASGGSLGTPTATMSNPLDMSGTGYTGNLADYNFGPSVFDSGSVVNSGGATLSGEGGGLLAGGSPIVGGVTATGAGAATAPGIFDMINKLPAAAAGLVKSFLSDNPNATQSDLLNLIGKIAPAALGAFASSQQAGAYKDLAEKYMSFGAPSRERYEASFKPGFSMASEPGYQDALDQTTKAFLHKASIAGNPADSPNAWQQTLKDVNSTFAFPALQGYRNQQASAGGLASLTAAGPALDTAGVNATKGVYDSIGAGAADIFSPKKSLADVMSEYMKTQQQRGY